MWQRLLGCVFAAILLAHCGTTDQVTTKPQIPCGVLSFESHAGMKPGEAESVAEMFSAALQKTGRFTVIERKRLDAILKEQGFQSMQAGEDVSRAGKILAVRKMFYGSIGMLGEKYVVNLKMVDVESSRIDRAISRVYDDDLEDIGEEFLPGIVQEILQAIDNPQMSQ
jgi:TolB-like protein